MGPEQGIRSGSDFFGPWIHLSYIAVGSPVRLSRSRG